MKRLWYHIAVAMVAIVVLFVSAFAGTKEVSSSNITVASRASFGLTQCVTVDNGYAYIGAENFVVALSLTTPQSPVYTSFSYPLEYIQDIATNTDYIFVTVGISGIEVIPKTTSSDLSTIKVFDFGTFTQRIAIDTAKNILYVSTQDSGVMIISIAGDSLSKLGTISGGFGTPNDVDCSNDTLVIGGSKGIYFYDISTPLTPAITDSITTRSSVFRVAFTDGLLVYVTQWRDGWTSYYTVNLSNTQGNYSIESGEGRIADIRVRGNDIFVLNTSGKLAYYKFNSGVIDKVSEIVLQSSAHDLDVDSTFIYLIEDDGFHIIDYSSGTLASVSMVYSSRVSYELATYQNYLFTSAGQSGIMVIDINDTLNSRFIGRIPCEKYSIAIGVKDTLLLCASLLQNFTIFNIADPVNPVFLGNVYVPGNPMDITWKDSISYIAANTGGVSLVSIKEPDAPVLIGNLSTGRATQGVETYGNYLIVSDLHSGSYLYSIQNVASPYLLATLEPSRAAALNDTLLILATLDSELIVYDIKDPQNPILLYTITLPQNGNSIKLLDNMLYVSCGNSGVRVYALGSSAATLEGYFESGNRTSDVLPLTSSLFYVSEEAGGVYLLSGTFVKFFDVVEGAPMEEGLVTLRENLTNTLGFVVESDKVTGYRLVDVTGRVVRMETLRGRRNVSITDLKAGVYYLVVNAGTQVEVKKVLIR